MAEGNCRSCDILTKYRCLKCNTFACKSSLDCSVFASESFHGWTAGSRVALCKECDDLEKWKENDEKENATDSEITRMVIVNDKGTLLYLIVCQEGFMNTEEFGHQEWDTDFQFSLKSQMLLMHTLWLWPENPKLLSQKFKLLVIYLERFLDFANSFANIEQNFQPL